MPLVFTLAARHLFHDRLRFVATLVGIVFSMILVTVQMLADLALIGVILKVLIGAAQRRRQTLGSRRGRGDPGESAEGG